MENPKCIVCFETFNKSTRKQSKCPYCNVEICRTCLQTYLLNDINDTPLCVNPECGHGMDREFVDSQVTKSFRLTTYKEHREKVLSDREKSRLPATQEEASEYLQATNILKQSQAEYLALKEELSAVYKKMQTAERTMFRAKNAIQSYGRIRMANQSEEKTEATQRATFIKPCPAENCKGFLSSAWKCGLCEQWTCPECHDLKGPNRDIEHSCDATKVATAQMLAKEAKSCPKCGTQICKIEGCDQMWCTICNTGFNWRTGKIASGPVHNPHYFEYLRKQGVTPANTNVGPGTCDRETDRNVVLALGGMHTRRTPITDSPHWEQDRYLVEVWRLMREAQDQYQYGRDTDPNEVYRQMRVRYMVQELSEEEWKAGLQKSEKDIHFQMAKRQVYDVFTNATRDIIRQVLNAEHNKFEICKQIHELIEYCNASLRKISERFNRKTQPIKISVSCKTISEVPNTIQHV